MKPLTDEQFARRVWWLTFLVGAASLLALVLLARWAFAADVTCTKASTSCYAKERR